MLVTMAPLLVVMGAGCLTLFAPTVPHRVYGVEEHS
jgi:hypothetical protein